MRAQKTHLEAEIGSDILSQLTKDEEAECEQLQVLFVKFYKILFSMK